MREDSNPRYPFEYAGFQNRYLQPLRHSPFQGVINREVLEGLQTSKEGLDLEKIKEPESLPLFLKKVKTSRLLGVRETKNTLHL